MLIPELTGIDVQALRDRIDGDVVSPGDDGWDLARQPWNLAFDQRPALVALPANAADVVAVVEFARRHGLSVAPQGTGHNAGPLGSLEDTVLLSTARMKGVEIDAGARRVRVQAGTLWLEVTEPASEHGLAPLAGSSPDVGVVGYSLGGGLSWLGRRHGLAADSVLAIEVVTADGRLRRVDAGNEPDLFWALRGGGGSFGVVTAMELQLFPVPELYAGAMFWPWERSAEVLHAWREWTATAPDEVTTSARIMQFPPIPDVPEPLRGRSFVTIDGAFLGSQADGAALFQPLRDLGPEIDMFGPMPPVGLSRIHGDPEQPIPALSASTMLRELTPEAIDAFVELTGPDAGSALLLAELRHLGGALAERRDGAGALGTLDGEYLMFAAGIPMDADLAAAIVAQGERLVEALGPWDTGRGYLNFAESATGAETFFGSATLERLREVRATVDPDRMFRANHPVD
jgi:FAD binding domain/Berberine and berberine like